ncbi:hypothetical protein KDD30_21935 (plasmid) [Photobacterium sp. GJ3]|uniref:hypothetical protein n=1 Tax=Photobacterium sp. GJ3 TaxID=2829502 RepID=UPI001B8C8F91|nr:hypothetical protein [Photobacterium sp. GJ3]QUJ69423.1 hypothetical protein KDD30_21935 [Photobacterium sp. GJ3]
MMYRLPVLNHLFFHFMLFSRLNYLCLTILLQALPFVFFMLKSAVAFLVTRPFNPHESASPVR